MTPEERNDLIATYAAGYDEVMNALNGFPADSLAAHPIPGKWSAREIVHHLGDSESTSAWRIRKLLVEENPLIQGYDQDQFATKLRYNDRDMAPALEAFRVARESTMQILNLMTEDDWKRAGTHTDSGRYTTEDWLVIYAKHAREHAAQIQQLKESLNT
jgi:DinB superfamily